MAKFCKNCGAPIKEGVRFCEHCGTPVEQPAAQGARCVYCGAAMKETSKFCPACGKTVGSPSGNAQNGHLSQMYRTAAERGIHVAGQDRPRAAEAPRTNPPQKRQPSGKKPVKAIALLLAVAILFTGLVTPGWMRSGGKGENPPPGGEISGGKDKTDKSLSIDDIYAEVKLSEWNQETKYANAMLSVAVQAQVNAMIAEEKFYRAVESGRPLNELEILLNANAEAWRIANETSSAAYMMGITLSDAEKTKGYKNTLQAPPSFGGSFENPFVITAQAANNFNRDRFDTAKEWAEYISQLHDHAQGDKVAKLAKVLHTDVKRAYLVIQQAQAIVSGAASEFEADIDDKTLKALGATKAAGKVSGVVLATYFSGGTIPPGFISGGAYVGGAVDAALEVADQSCTIVLGENHKVTRAVQDFSSEVAPLISLVSFGNILSPGSWGNVGDYLCNGRYIVDFGVDLWNGKLFAVDMGGWDHLKMFVERDPKKFAEYVKKDAEKCEKFLENMGLNAKEFVKALEEEGGGPGITDMLFSELESKDLAEIGARNAFPYDGCEELTKELFEEFVKELDDKGLIEEDSPIREYNPLNPPEDLPEYEFEKLFEETEPVGEENREEGSETEPGSGGEPFIEPGETEPFEGVKAPDVSQLTGAYMGQLSFFGPEYEFWHLADNGKTRTLRMVYENGVLREDHTGYEEDDWIIDYDPEEGTGYYFIEKSEGWDITYEAYFYFTDINGVVHMRRDITVTSDGKVSEHQVFEGVKDGVNEEPTDVAKYVGSYAGTSGTIYYHPNDGSSGGHESDTRSFSVSLVNGVPVPSYGGNYEYLDGSITWNDEAKSGGAVLLVPVDGKEICYGYSWYFDESDDGISLYVDMNGARTKERNCGFTATYAAYKSK